MPRTPRRPLSKFPARRAAAASSIALACTLALTNYFAHTPSATAAAPPQPSASERHAAHGAESRPPNLDANSPAAARVLDAYGELPLQFEANRGQTDSSVKFLARGAGYNLFLTPSEAVLALARPTSARERDARRGGAAHERAVLRMRLLGSVTPTAVEGLEPLASRSNYFTGRGASARRAVAETYARVKYSGVYRGVDAVYYGNRGRLEYDFVVHPHADPRQIVVAFDGGERVELDGRGELVIHTALGEVRQHRPTVYQETAGGARSEVSGRYVKRGARSVGFEVGAYDPSLPLVIDPVLVYSTYLGGGSSNDTAHGVAVDAAGNAYVTGQTLSTDFPTTAGAFQTTFGGFNYDAYVTKLSPSGTSIVYSTYLGGDGTDEAYDIAVDADGNAYVAGRTISTNFPVTPGAFQPAFGGGTYPGGLGGDAFVTKLNPTGSALVYSTYLGGASTDYGYGLALDAARNVYVTGQTSSDNFPLSNPLQPVKRGQNDAFVTKLNPTGTALVYSTYFGGATTFPSGSASGLDNAFDIAVDATGRAHVVGETQTTDFPVTPGAFQQSFGGLGAYEGDAYVAKFNAEGTAVVYSTYLGGSYGDSGDGIALDADGNAYVTGQTASVNFPVANAYQPALANAEGIHDAFVTKLNPTGTALVYSTYLGGGVSDSAQSVAVDAGGRAYVTGGTNSNFFPVRNAVQGTLAGTSIDAFVTKLNAAGTALVYSTFLGGAANENGYAVAVDAAGDAYVVGFTTSRGFPTANPVQGARNGEGDAFVSKIHVGEDEATHRISGRVTGGDGAPLAGVEINLFGAARTRTYTSEDGRYSFEGLRSGGDYSLTAYKPCVSFTTANDTVNDLTSDQTVDFNGSVVTFAVRGRVLDSNGTEPLGGVTIKLTGAQTATTRTDGGGNYSFPALPGCRDYTVTPSSTNISFNPPSRAYANLGMDQSFADFAGTRHQAPTVSVTSPANNATFEAGTAVRVAADAQARTGHAITKVEFYLGDSMGINLKPLQTDTTAPYGGFDLTGQPAGTYSIYAYAYDDSVGVGFSEPVFYTVRAPHVLYSISGQVADARGVGLGGATVTLAGAGFAEATTDSNGQYQIANLEPGESYSVTAWKDGYTITPTVLDFDNLSANQTANFTATPEPGTLVNVALATNGGVATAASSYGPAYPASSVINGDRRGRNWNAGGGWNDATSGAFPDWVEVAFNGERSVSEVDIFTLQDDPAAPVEPTEALQFTRYGVTSFEVRYWTGAAWAEVPGAAVTGNDRVWRKLTFPAVNTTKLRVVVRGALAGYSRLTEVEAWGTGGSSPAPASRTNVALATHGGVATASSSYSSAYPASSVINGDRQGLGWNAGGGWNDATANSYPDWVEVAFAGEKSIEEVSVFTLQDNPSAPVEPTEAMTFTKYGATAMRVEYWTGAAWAEVPGGAIAGNDRVWRKLSFAPVSTTKVRVVVTGALAGYSRLVEVEAWQPAAAAPQASANHALASNGGVATASSSYSFNYPAASVINGDRRGLNWNAGGGWNDATGGSFPDWVEVAFAGEKSLTEINVFTLQDNPSAPVEPTEALQFTKYGVTGMRVEYWTGAAWAEVPGGAVAGNDRVWRKFTFPAVATRKIRVVVTGALAGHSRLAEIEAY